MKVATPSLLLMLIVAAEVARAEAPVPAPWPAQRYEAISRRSPFALATPVDAPVAPQASFAVNWYVGGVGRIGDVDFVTIKSRDATVQFSLFGQEPNHQHGVTLSEVTWSETLGRSTVTIRKGLESARLEFNEAEVRGAAVAKAPAPARPSSTPSVAPGATPPKSNGLMVLKRHAESLKQQR